MKTKAFTLVELIVVITILAILWTIAFISLSWYSKEARDAKRATDTSSLLSKINIEETRWTPLSDLITNTEDAYLQILWNSGSLVKTFWEADFKTLKEDEKNFRDPSNKSQNYPMAYAVWGSGRDAYKFIEIATVSEKNNTAVIKWNYYKLEEDDAKSLFLTGGTTVNDWGINIENWGNNLPYIPNEKDKEGGNSSGWSGGEDIPWGWEEENYDWDFVLLYRVWQEWYWNWNKVVQFNFESNWESSIDWWDWKTETINTWKISHTYENEKDYIVKISGDIKRYYNNSISTNYHWKLIEVKKWDNIEWSSMEGMFYSANNLTKIPKQAPDLNEVINMNRMFEWASSFDQPLDWNTSSVTDMNRMFSWASNFDQPLVWNTSSVINMSGMFSWASKFNQALAWDTNIVADMSHMFSYANNFNQPLVWNTSSVKNMYGMFNWANNFDQPLVWNTSNVESMGHMFELASSFNQPLAWDTSRVTNMRSMFDWASNFNSSLNFEISSVVNMNRMFYNAERFNQNLSNWNVSNVTIYSNFDTWADAWLPKNKPIFK